MLDRTITFVTGNAGKIATARTHLEPLGFGVEQVCLDLDEIQSATVADVAIHKAQQAHRALRRPVMVEDSGFGIDELGGWPGPLIKHTLTALGPEGLCRVADQTRDRSARFTSVLVYIDSHGIPRVFTDEGEAGVVAKTPSDGDDEAAWSPLWNIFIPATADTTLSTLSSQDRDRLFSAWRESSVFARLGASLSKNQTSVPGTDADRLRSSDLVFDFPAERIADRPAVDGSDRLLVIDRGSAAITHHMADDLPGLLPPGSLVVVNNSAVVKAALRKAPDDGTYLHITNPQATSLEAVECLCPWKPRVGATVAIDGGRFVVEAAPELGRDVRVGRIIPADSAIARLQEFMNRHGHVPIPIYVNAQRDPDDKDATDYQNVYASVDGSIACPTAGLHLTEPRLEALRSAGHDVVEVTCHIGYGTWKSLANEYVDDHHMDAETCSIGAEALAALQYAKRTARPIVAVGTSTVRTLETHAQAILNTEQKGPVSAQSQLYISPGYQFSIPDVMFTNFAYPKSPIMAMTAAFTGSWPLLRNAYTAAVDRGDYYFLTYGDAMLIR